MFIKYIKVNLIIFLISLVCFNIAYAMEQSLQQYKFDEEMALKLQLQLEDDDSYNDIIDKTNDFIAETHSIAETWLVFKEENLNNLNKSNNELSISNECFNFAKLKALASYIKNHKNFIKIIFQNCNFNNLNIEKFFTNYILKSNSTEANYIFEKKHNPLIFEVDDIDTSAKNLKEKNIKNLINATDKLEILDDEITALNGCIINKYLKYNISINNLILRDCNFKAKLRGFFIEILLNSKIKELVIERCEFSDQNYKQLFQSFINSENLQDVYLEELKLDDNKCINLIEIIINETLKFDLNCLMISDKAKALFTSINKKGFSYRNKKAVENANIKVGKTLYHKSTLPPAFL
jgi:hypothetical protein